jgi:hypothetical protein
MAGSNKGIVEQIMDVFMMLFTFGNPKANLLMRALMVAMKCMVVFIVFTLILGMFLNATGMVSDMFDPLTSAVSGIWGLVSGGGATPKG